MREIFLSYRRADTAGHAGRLADAVDARFGRGTVFRDVASIDAGSDFVHAIEGALTRARVVLALVGNTWATETTPSGTRRIDDPEDFVRLELATAFKQRVPVLPVLVEGARMPAEDALPPDLAPLARLQALELSEDRWAYDTGRLMEAIVRVGRLTPAAGAGNRRRLLGYAAGGLLVAAIASGAWVARRPRASGIEGVWRLPSGSFWTVWKDGDAYRVEETHYQSREVWRRGTGRVEGEGRFVVELVPVFEAPERYRWRYELKVAADGRVLAGSVREMPADRQGTVTLERQ